MSRWGGRWGDRWGGRWGAIGAITPVVTSPTTGGYSDEDFRRYRRHLEKLAKISEERNKKLYVKQEIQEIIEEIVDEIPVKVTEIKKLDDGRKKIDYAALNSEIATIREWIELIVRRNSAIKAQEMEDEQILMMILGVI